MVPCKEDLPEHLLQKITETKMYLSHLGCSYEHFLRQINEDGVERMNKIQRILFDNVMDILPHMRMYTSTMRELLVQQTLSRVPKLDRLQKRRGDGIVKRGRWVTDTVRATVDGKVYTSNCKRIKCEECPKQFISVDQFMIHVNCKSEGEHQKDQYVEGRKCPLCRNPRIDLSYKTQYNNHVKHCDGFGTVSSRRAVGQRTGKRFSQFCLRCGPGSTLYLSLIHI